MATRNLLPIGFKDEFASWLKDNGYTIEKVKGDFEVLRAKKGKNWIIVFEKIGAKEHLSVRDCDVKVVRAFLRERKK